MDAGANSREPARDTFSLTRLPDHVVWGMLLAGALAQLQHVRGAAHGIGGGVLDRPGASRQSLRIGEGAGLDLRYGRKIDADVAGADRWFQNGARSHLIETLDLRAPLRPSPQLLRLEPPPSAEQY